MLERARNEAQTKNSATSGQGDEWLYPVDFHRAAKFVRHHKFFILRGAGASVILAFLFLLLAPPVFTAQTQVLLDPALPNVIEEESTAPTAMDSQKLETEMAVLRSEEISLAAIKQLNLADDPEFGVRVLSDYLPSWAVSQAQSERADRRRSQLMLAAFRKNLNVRRVGVSYAIDVFFTASDPELASKIANGVADAYVKFQLELAQRGGSRRQQMVGGTPHRHSQLHERRVPKIAGAPREPGLQHCEGRPDTDVGRNRRSTAHGVAHV